MLSARSSTCPKRKTRVDFQDRSWSAESKCGISGATFLALIVSCQNMTPDFDPTRVDWNNPDVEYLMKHFKMATANQDDEIAALTKSNEELRASNEELRRAYSELEAKYEAHIGMYNRLTGKGGAVASGAPAGAGADDGRREDPARRRSYNGSGKF